MSFQDRTRLWAVALGVDGDTPPNDLQPPLVDGIHLRWAFPTEVGFPWHGYYLFRRLTEGRTKHRCLKDFVSSPPDTPLPDFSTPIGSVGSDTPLTYTNQFPPPFRFEFDLANRNRLWFDLPPGEPALRATVKIGFHRDAERCVTFDPDSAGFEPNPLLVDGTSFETQDASGQFEQQNQIVPSPGGTGLDTSHQLTVTLPCPATDVRLRTINHAGPGKISALNLSGVKVDEGVLAPGITTSTLTGDAITAVVLFSPDSETTLIEVCFDCSSPSDSRGDDRDTATVGQQTVELTARLEGIPMATATATGSPGDVVTVELAADAMDRVEMTSAAASLIDICFDFARAILTNSPWEKLDDFPYPLCLPVAHADYPCASAPATEPAAQTVATDRIRYGTAAAWTSQPFAELHERLEHLVDGGPAAGPMADRATTESGDPAPPPGVTGSFVQQLQKPLELVLLGAIHPPIAQMVGLYWADQTAVVGQQYDYLLLADHDDRFGGDPDTALTVLPTLDFSDVDGFLLVNKVRQPAPPLAPPDRLTAFSLPGSTRRNSAGDLVDATNNAGLRWSQKVPDELASPTDPVLYHLWRSGPESDEPTPPPPASAHTPITEKRPLTAYTLSAEELGLAVGESPPQRSSEWPTEPMHYIDTALAEGWYSYQASAIDLFGRHSANSDHAQWRQWDPVPIPEPWYYRQPPGDQVVHPALIRLLDKNPPPAPVALEAWLLDPADPTVFNDATYQAWRGAQPDSEQDALVGLRISWEWTALQAAQAPDTAEFRIYWQPTRINAIAGAVTDVTAPDALTSIVATNIPNTAPADAYAGLWLRADGTQFKILSSEAGSPLRVTVGNAGAAKDQRPRIFRSAAVSFPPSHALALDYSDQSTWDERIVVVDFDDHVTIDGDNRRYEILLPFGDDPVRRSYDLGPDTADPIRYGALGVSAADGRTHTADPRGEGRVGNEGPVAGPAPVVQVLRTRPDAPPPPADGEENYASPADYHHTSYYTFTWAPAPNLSTHIFRALDDTIFKTDRSQRPRSALGPDAPVFPADDPRFDLAKRTQVATELNTLNSFTPATQGNEMLAAYRELSNDGKRVLAGLPGNERAFAQLTTEPLAPDEPDNDAPGGLKWRRIGPDADPGSLAPADRAYVDMLDGRATNRYFYRSAYLDAAGNVGPLSPASAPVRLPEITPLPAPRMTKVVGGDRQITVRWTAHAQATGLRLYHTTDPTAVDDLRLFTEPPIELPADAQQFVHTDRPGQVTTYYRIVALSEAQLAPGTAAIEVASRPSGSAAGRAFDLSPPEPASWVASSWVSVDGGGAELSFDPSNPALTSAISLEWSSPSLDAEALVQRLRPGSLVWENVISWTADVTTHLDANLEAIDPTELNRYRIRLRRPNGQTSLSVAVDVPAVVEVP